MNQLLPAEHIIRDLSYTKNEQLGVQEADRKAIFDLYCTSEKGERFIVEVQKAKQNWNCHIKQKGRSAGPAFPSCIVF